MLETERMPDLVEVMRMGKHHHLKNRQLPLQVDENLTVSLSFYVGFPHPVSLIDSASVHTYTLLRALMLFNLPIKSRPIYFLVFILSFIRSLFSFYC